MPPGSPPPEVPEEFAEAYRAAYERALASQTGGPQHREVPERRSGVDSRREPEEDLPADGIVVPSRDGPLLIGTHRTQDEYDDGPTWFDRVRDSSWFVPVLLALLAIALILGAYVVGRAFAERVSGSDGEPQVVSTEEDADRIAVTDQKPGPGAYSGAINPIANITAKAKCVAGPSEDDNGAQVTYVPAHLVDGKASTAWRCDGAAVGEKIRLVLPKRIPIGEVGLIPGYAKTDPETRVDRFAENNRVTQVRWTFGKTVLTQKFGGAADDRSLQLLRVPKTRAKKVFLEILEVRKGPRDITAISEIRLGRAAD